MKLYLSFIACLTLTIFTCNGASGKGEYRIPYRSACYWGLSDEHGNIIIPCKYADLQYSYPYVFVTDTGKQGTITIFDYNGQFVDTCVYYTPIGNRYCIFHESKSGATPGTFTYNDVKSNMYQTTLFYSAISITLLRTPLLGYVLWPDNSRHQLPGTVNALVNDLNYAVVMQNGKCGIYNMKNDSFTIPATYDSITFIKPALLLGHHNGETILFDLNGKQFPCHPDDNAIYIDTTTLNYVVKEKVKPTFKTDTISQTIDKITGKPVTSVRTRNTGYAGAKSNGYRLISKDGKTLIPAERDWEYGPQNAHVPVYIRLLKSYDSMKYGESSFQLADLNGQILLPSAGDITHIEGNLYRITDNSGGKRQEYIYDMVQKKTIISADQQENISPDNNGFYTTTKDRIHYYYTNKGALITTVADTISSWQKEWNLVKKIDLKLEDSVWRKTGVFTKTYYAFRSTVNEHFTVYDQHYNKINTDYEGFTPFVSSSKWISFQKNGKWGLVDYDFKEVIPPLYDNMLTTDDSCAIGIVAGVKKRINLRTFRAIDITGFDDFGFSYFGNKFLALKNMFERPGSYHFLYPRTQTIYVTNSNGKIIDSMLQNDTQLYKYEFTAKGKIIKYPDRDRMEHEGEVSIIGKTKESYKNCPYKFFKAEVYYGKALLLQCVNDSDELGMISADDFSVVVPFGKYSFMFTYPSKLPSVNKDGRDLEVLLIKGGTNEMHDAANNSRNMNLIQGKPMQSDRESVGYYLGNGEKLWSE